MRRLTFWSEWQQALAWQQALTYCNMLTISLWIKFVFVTMSWNIWTSLHFIKSVSYLYAVMSPLYSGHGTSCIQTVIFKENTFSLKDMLMSLLDTTYILYSLHCKLRHFFRHYVSLTIPLSSKLVVCQFNQSITVSFSLPVWLTFVCTGVGP